MTPDRWRRVREVLYAASQLEGGSRVQYLDESCAQDNDCRNEVERLLAALDASGDFLQPVSRPDSCGGRLRIGPYLVLDQAGLGGMGIVYHAVRDNDYRQEVALKIVRPDVRADFLIERFHIERQALALLNHPNIARLLDGGTTPDGWPYLVMEWVDGQPVTDYCKTRNLNLKDRLRLFLEVCGAVEHAHRNLVVHRDLKPSNILIMAEGIPKLLDFGIAKIFSPEMKDDPGSRAATRLLTPEYASPEQLRGETVTTATDVYSLGAVLYEMLTGVRPRNQDRKVPLELAGTPCGHEPPAPSAATGAGGVTAGELRSDLDNIVLKAMQHDPARRYASAAHFSEDIRRYLQGMPVIARKDTLGYRVGKFARRNRVGVIAGALIVAALAVGGAAALWEGRIAVAERARAERRFNDVRKLAHSVLFEFDDAIKNLPGSTQARSFVVKRTLEYLDGLASEARGDRSLQEEIAAAYQRVGAVQGDPQFPNLGDTRGALASSQKCLAIREALSRADPGNPELRLGLASIHAQIGNILDVSGHSKSAIEHAVTALAMYEALSRGRAGDLKLESAFLANTYIHANRLRLAGELDQAAAVYRKAVDLSDQLLAAHPADSEGKIHLAASLDGLGGVLQEQGDTADALDTRRRGLAIRQELATAYPDNAEHRRQLGFSHHNVGLSLLAESDLAGALEHFRQELALFESLSAADPNDAQARRNRSVAHKQIGDTLMRNADAKEALNEYRQSLEIDRALASADPRNVKALLDLSFSEGKTGFALAKVGRTQAGLALLRSGVERQEKLVNQDLTNGLMYGYLANSYTRLADAMQRSGDPGGGLDYYRKAVEARLKLADKTPASNANRGALAECYTTLGNALAPVDSAEALRLHNRAIALLESLSAADVNDAQNRKRLADALAGRARVYARVASQSSYPLSERREQWDKARSNYQRSHELWMALDREKKLEGADRKLLAEVARELVTCENSLAKLSRD
jgi:tetratricopeptide (TPR) repeat protein